MEDYLKELETQNSRTEIEVTQLKNELAQLRTQAPAAIRSIEDYVKLKIHVQKLRLRSSKMSLHSSELKHQQHLFRVIL